MKTFRISYGAVTTLYNEVQAESAEEAVRNLETPFLCHQCAEGFGDFEVDENCEVYVTDEDLNEIEFISKDGELVRSSEETNMHKLSYLTESYYPNSTYKYKFSPSVEFDNKAEFELFKVEFDKLRTSFEKRFPKSETKEA